MAIIASTPVLARPRPDRASRPSPAARVARGALVLVSAGIVVIGARFLIQPDAAAAGFGLPASPDDPFLAVKGDRDIGSGLLLATVLGLGGRRVAGWAGIAASVMPFADMAVVLAHGGSPVTAFAVHGTTALVMVAAGATLVRGARDDA